MEAFKTYNVLREGARKIVKSVAPTLSDQQVETVLDRLFEICKDYKDVEDLTGCIYTNVRRVLEEVSVRG